MTTTGQRTTCEDAAPLLVDLADGALDAVPAEQVRLHCARCGECRDTLAALRELPELLRGEEELSAAAWARQRDSILATYDSMRAAEREERRGFDSRIFLPIAAAALIALAGIVSLRSDPVGGNAQPARAAFVLALGDLEVAADLADVLGEPWFDGDVPWAWDRVADDVAGLWLLPTADGLGDLVDETNDLESLDAQ